MKVHELNEKLIIELKRILEAGDFEALSGVLDIDKNSIDRAYQLYQDYKNLIHGIELLKHDLRDDYKDSFRITIGK
jgi:hypothetical protein